jgi:hypothetical protein
VKSQNRGILEKVKSELRTAKPVWVPDSVDTLRSSDLVAGLKREEIDHLALNLGLGGVKDLEDANVLQDFIPAPIDAPMFLEGLHTWWQNHHLIERGCHDQDAYPSFLNLSDLRNPSDPSSYRVAWFTMLALAAFRTLGRTLPTQHRNFIQKAFDEKWWADIALSKPPKDSQTWIKQLEKWSDSQLFAQEWRPWKAGLLDLYTITRWLDEYIEIFTDLPRLVQSSNGNERLSQILKPSTSETLARVALEAAPLANTLGIGANWLVRELIRCGFYESDDVDHVRQFAFSAGQRVSECLASLNCNLYGEPRLDRSSEILQFIVDRLGLEKGKFLGDYDLPFWTITRAKYASKLREMFLMASQGGLDIGAEGDFVTQDFEEVD